jgi:hypothetical protein
MSPLCRKNSAAITALESNEPCTVFRLFTIARRVYRSHFTVSSEVGPLSRGPAYGRLNEILWR